MKNSQVIKEISKKLDLKENDVKNTINELVEIIIMKNCIGENVYISKLGKFMIVKKNERMVRNPRNGEKSLCKEYYYPKFKAKSNLTSSPINPIKRGSIGTGYNSSNKTSASLILVNAGFIGGGKSKK